MVKIKLALLLAVLFSSCGLSTQQKMIIASAPVARVIEASRDAEAFEHPTQDRSTYWHVAKVPQFGAWACWGYATVDQIKKEPSLKNVAIGVGSLGLAWASFEISLWGFRRLQ